MPGGPQPIERTTRMALVQEIVDRVLVVHQEHVLAIGLYGSTARGADGPFSDIEIFCVLDGADVHYTHEWSHGPWKAEVNFVSEDILLSEAAEIDEQWSLTHGCYCNVHALYDPHNFFVKLSDVVFLQPHERFEAVIRSHIVGEVYEAIGKLRNAQYIGNKAFLPELALNMAKYGAFLIGLANRHLYTSASHMQAESLTLPQRPSGYDELCHLVMTGDLSDPRRIIDACESFWSGVEQWADLRGIPIEEPRRIPF